MKEKHPVHSMRSILVLMLLFSLNSFGQNATELKAIISKARNKLRGKSSISEMTITTVRAKYTLK